MEDVTQVPAAVEQVAAPAVAEAPTGPAKEKEKRFHAAVWTEGGLRKISAQSRKHLKSALHEAGVDLTTIGDKLLIVRGSELKVEQKVVALI